MNNVSVVATLLVVVFFQVGPGTKTSMIFSNITIIHFFCFNAFREQPGEKPETFLTAMVQCQNEKCLHKFYVFEHCCILHVI